MRTTIILMITMAGVALGTACSSGTAATQNKAATPTPQPTVFLPKDGLYQGRGRVTKMNTELGTVEIDHEAIPELMPAMKMEFNVEPASLLKGVKDGDSVKFTIEYRQRQEKVVAIAPGK